MLPCSTDWRGRSSSPARRCGSRTPSPPTAWGSRACGRTASPATARSCWSASPPPDDESLVRQLVQWHAYARRRGLDLDLVVLDERPGDAADAAQGRPPGRPRRPAARQAGRGVRPGRGQGPGRRRGAPRAAARVVLGGGRGSLAEQLERPTGSGRPPAAAGRDRRSRTVRARRGPPRRPRACCSGTASAGSRRTAAST